MARAAGRRNLPYTLSTMGNTSIEDLAAAAHAAGQDEIWFQLYVIKDMAQTREWCSGPRPAGTGCWPWRWTPRSAATASATSGTG